MKLNSYLNFDGQAAAAMARYAEVLGGTLQVMRFGDVPASEDMGMGRCDPEGVMHAALMLPGGDTLMASDVPQGRFERPQGFSVSVSLDSVEEVERIFAALSEGGTVVMPPQETFWSERFGMFVDRWSTPWLLNGPDKPMG